VAGEGDAVGDGAVATGAEFAPFFISAVKEALAAVP